MVLPAKVQASIMSWLDESSTAVPSGQSGPAAAEDGHSYPVLTPADLFSLSSRGVEAGSPGVVVKDGFLGREQALQAQAAALEVENDGEMKPAGMGRGDGVWHGQQSRGDSILWITDGIRGKGELPEGLENLLMRLSALRGPLNDGCGGPTTSSPAGLGLVKNTTSVQLARYPGDGRGYVRHRDTPRSAQDSEEAERKITALYYLNPDWKTSMGGQLRVHLESRPEAATEEGGPRLAGEEEEEAGRKWDIEPVLDRLVLFRSDLVDHEV
ncbi:unnamed protein product, partial [Ectocarpus fasciculatus]